MLKVTVEIEANDWGGIRLAMRQAYHRDLEGPLMPGKKGQTPYRLVVTDVEDNGDENKMYLNGCEGVVVWPTK